MNLKEQRSKLIADLQAIADGAKAADRSLTHEEKEKATKLMTEVKAATDKLAEQAKAAEDTQRLTEFLDSDYAKALNDTQTAGAGAMPARGRSMGQLVTKSREYRRLMDTYGHDGILAESAKGIRMDPVHLAGGLKALITSGADSTGASDIGGAIAADHYGLAEQIYRPLGLRDLITVGTTTSDRIEYAQALPIGGGTTSKARGVKESKTLKEAAGLKPQSDLAFRKASADIITIAHWVPATKKALSDVGQLQTLIDGFLREGIARETERLIVEGNQAQPAESAGEEWDGILNTEGVQKVDWQGNIFATARRMITQVEALGSETTGYIVSPEIAERLDLATTNTGRYLGAGPFQMGPDTLWGRPRVTVPGVPADTIIGGDLRQCILWDREQATITATDSHDDFFVRNLVAILGEARAGFGILNPSALAVASVQAEDAAPGDQ